MTVGNQSRSDSEPRQAATAKVPAAIVVTTPNQMPIPPPSGVGTTCDLWPPGRSSNPNRRACRRIGNMTKPETKQAGIAVTAASQMPTHGSDNDKTPPLSG